MILRQVANNLRSSIRKAEIATMIFYYRYVSLAVTSLFFLFGEPKASIDKKIFIITCIGISAVIINYLYLINRNNKPKTLLLLLIETIGNSILLLPTGGLNSPYVWYALNSIFVSSMLLGWKYCWLNVLIYLFVSTYVLQLLIEKNSSVIKIISEQSNLILSFILITVVIEMLSIYAKSLEYKSSKLEEANKQLTLANQKIKQLMNYSIELYQSLHLLTRQQDRKNLIELIVSCAEKVTKSSSVVFIDSPEEELKIVSKYPDQDLNNEIIQNQNLIFDSMLCDQPVTMTLQNQPWMFIEIKCSYKTFGALGIRLDMPEYSVYQNEIIEQMNFLSSLSSIVFEKFDLEQFNNKLIINEERNRIANEIHDSILQRLFSISCGLYAIIKKSGIMGAKEQISELNLIRNTINEVMKDLRSTIYGYSFRKYGTSGFMDSVNKYINEIKTLNNINITFETKGSHDLLAPEQKNALYRIICESVSNSVRHGRATRIDILLSIDSKATELTVNDNGAGFDTRIINEKNSLGLGVLNIQNLVNYLGGEINYTSEIGKGSTVFIKLPQITSICKEEAV